MHRGVHTGVVLTPLIVGLGFLLFAVFTEYWTSLDFSQIRKYDRSAAIANNGSDQQQQQQIVIKYRNSMYYLKRQRIEFPKYTSLYGECNEYKLIEILEPVPPPSSASHSSAAAAASGSDAGAAPASTEPILSTISTLQINDPVMEASFAQLKQQANCLSREECQRQLNNQASDHSNDHQTCFCCSKPSSDSSASASALSSHQLKSDDDESKLFKKSPQLQQCCYPNSKVCDVYHDCMDKSPAASDDDSSSSAGAATADCPSRKLFYSTQSHDFKHGCLRNQYNMWQFMVNTCNKPNEFYKMFRSHSYSVKIFLIRLMTLAGFSLCIVFTLLCLVTMLFVICCRNLRDANSVGRHRNVVQYRGGSTSAAGGGMHASASMAERLNRNETLNCGDGNCVTAAENDLDDDGFDESSSKIRNCCRCNCLLCPFAFFTVFAWLAFLSFTFAFCLYLTCLSYVRQSYLIYDTEYVPMYITSAYQHNPWLFNVQQFGVSFYAMLVAYVAYVVVVVCASCITCRMEISPAWRGRYADSYEVLQMQHDCMITPPLPAAHLLPKSASGSTSNKKEKKKAAHLAEEERISNLSEMQMNTANRSSKNNSRLLINDNQY